MAGTFLSALAPGGTITQPWTGVPSKLLKLNSRGDTGLALAPALKRVRITLPSPLNVHTSGGSVGVDTTHVHRFAALGNENVVTIPATENNGVAAPPAEGTR